MSYAISDAVARLDLDGVTPQAMTDLLLGSRGLADVVGERLEQVFKHGFTPDHDSHHKPEDLPLASLTYLEDGVSKLLGGNGVRRDGNHLSPEVPASWPWRDLFRPTDARTNLVKAAAFLIAAIDRLDGQEPDAPAQEPYTPDPDQGATHDEGTRGYHLTAEETAIFDLMVPKGDHA
jgi:hypothetical protein